MEGNVSDISEALSVLTEELRMLRASNDAQYAEICRLTRLVESQNAEIPSATKRLRSCRTDSPSMMIPTRTPRTVARLPRKRG